MRFLGSAACIAAALAMAGCGPRPLAQSDSHIAAVESPATARAAPDSRIPAPVRTVPLPPPPEAREGEIKYSVVVANQPVREVLLAMARETRINFDIHPGIEGTVNLNAIDQSLKQILNRMSRQVDMRWEIEGQTITVMPDTPYLRNYRVDYVNLSRDVTEAVGIATQVISGGVPGSNVPAAGTGANNSTLTITGTSKHRFWETLEKNLRDMLRETDKLLPEGSSETFVQARARGPQARVPNAATTPATRGTTSGQSRTTEPAAADTPRESELTESRLTFREAASVIVNAESGIVTVRATSRQHEKVAEFLEQVTGSSRRQVLIEATIVEVTLNDNYQTGVDWSALGINGLGYTFTQAFIGPNLPNQPFSLDGSTPNSFSIAYRNPNAAVGGSISSTIKLLDQFGRTRVLSSPKLMVINNQTAVLKVVNNEVYFTIKADTVTNQTNTQTTFTTTQNVVPVGFIMTVTPQISDADMVTINVRPTVTRVIGTVQDPNPALKLANVVSSIPVTQTREMESVLKVSSGQTAVLGGLMLDTFESQRAGLPVASRVPVLGDLVSKRNDTTVKSELVVFIRPYVVRNASVEGDLAAYRRYLPDREFFKDTRNPFPCVDEALTNLEKDPRGINLPCKPPAANGGRADPGAPPPAPR
jgi:general secretion pathway protein D